MRKQVGDIHTSSPLMDQCTRHPFGVCYVLGSDAKSWGVSNLGALAELSSQKLLSMNVPCYLERGPCLFCSSRNPWSYLHTFPRPRILLVELFGQLQQLRQLSSLHPSCFLVPHSLLSLPSILPSSNLTYISSYTSLFLKICSLETPYIATNV